MARVTILFIKNTIQLGQPQHQQWVLSAQPGMTNIPRFPLETRVQIVRFETERCEPRHLSAFPRPRYSTRICCTSHWVPYVGLSNFTSGRYVAAWYWE